MAPGCEGTPLVLLTVILFAGLSPQSFLAITEIVPLLELLLTVIVRVVLPEVIFHPGGSDHE